MTFNSSGVVSDTLLALLNVYHLLDFVEKDKDCIRFDARTARNQIQAIPREILAHCIQDHILSVSGRESGTSLLKHIAQTGHTFSFENTKIIREITFKSRTIQRGIETEKLHKTVNGRDKFNKVAQVWGSLVVGSQKRS